MWLRFTKKQKNGTTYVYDSVSYWDKDLKQPRSKRKLIGKLDPDTGEIVPTGKKGPRPNNMEPDRYAGRPTSDDMPSPATALAECGETDSAPGIQDEPDAWALYEDCRRKPLETEFTKAKVWLYGKQQEVEYLSLDLLWGQGLYQELRFVLVVTAETGLRSVLVSTDLSLTPVQIIELYGWRFSIESCFRGLK